MAFDKVCPCGIIICPCKYCKNGEWLNRDTTKEHLIVDGFMKGYTHWIPHGEDFVFVEDNIQQNESFDMFDDMHNLVYDALGVNDINKIVEEEPNEQAKIFYKLLDDAQQELFSGRKQFSKLKLIIQFLHLKSLGKWSNKTFTMLLELSKEAFPDLTNSLPKSYSEVKKIIGGREFTCIKPDTCPNDCKLYWKDYENDTQCHVCNTSRYLETKSDLVDGGNSMKCKKILVNVLRYFPLKPRLQRLFMYFKTASSLRWHKEEYTKDGYLRHPSGSPVLHVF